MTKSRSAKPSRIRDLLQPLFVENPDALPPRFHDLFAGEIFQDAGNHFPRGVHVLGDLLLREGDQFAFKAKSARS